MLKIIDIDKNHLEEAHKLAVMDYELEHHVVTALPNIKAVPDLTWFAEHKKGVVAYANGKMVGYLCALGPFDKPFGCNPSTKGVWSPAHCNSAIGENKVRIYKELYQSIAEKWVSDNALIHSITLYAHDELAQNAFFTYGFGLRCIDAAKLIEAHEIRNLDSVSYEELSQENTVQIVKLNNALVTHLGKSPCFLNYAERTPEMVSKKAANNNIRYFVAKKHEEIIAYIKTSNDGEHFACSAQDMINICGAYLKDEYRGSGIFDELLFYTENIFAADGFKRIGVDFESFNPTAYGFWLKHFTAYTYSVVRRIDERSV